jgi:hypothetical protein
MHVRRRVWHTGAVLTATAATVLVGAPAQADCGSAEPAKQWQVGMQLGAAPVSLTGMGGLPAVLLGALPESRVAVEDARGQNLLRLNASTRLAEAPRPAFSDDLSHELPGTVGLVDRVPGVHVAETEQGRAPAAAPAKPVAEAPSQQVDRATREAVAAPVEVALQSPGSDSVLGGQYAWVPIEGVAGLAPGAGVPWAGGLALLVLVAGAGAVTVVARHRHPPAG